MKRLLKGCILIFICLRYASLQAQEFPKGWVIYIEGMQGASTRFHATPDIYVANLQLSPQLTVIPNRLRVAALSGVLFNNKKLYGTYGAGLCYKLSTINVNPFGSLLNLQLQLQHMRGTARQRLVGGGIKAELGQIIMTGITAHRDYRLQQWWFQAGIGYNLLRTKRRQPQDPFEKP